MAKKVTKTSGLTQADIEGIKVVADHTEEVLKKMDSAIASALEEIGLVAESYAKKLCPVDTGRLRNSITHTIAEDAAAIGTNVEYAEYVEFGTHRRKAKPFLRPAANDHGGTYRAILEKHMGKG